VHGWIVWRPRPGSRQCLPRQQLFHLASRCLDDTFGIRGSSDSRRCRWDHRICYAQAPVLAISFGSPLLLRRCFASEDFTRVHFWTVRLVSERAQGLRRVVFDLEQNPADESAAHHNATQTLSLKSNHVLSNAKWLEQSHPRMIAGRDGLPHGVRPDNPSYSTQVRYIRPMAIAKSVLADLASLNVTFPLDTQTLPGLS